MTQNTSLTAVFGAGTLFSSDGPRLPTRGKSVTARALSRYFANDSLSTYTHVADQHAHLRHEGPSSPPGCEAHYVLHEILRSATDLPITEHVTATHGTTLSPGRSADAHVLAGRCCWAIGQLEG
ncbi:Tn3 family transposase [Nocardia sp. NPDC004750]